MFGDGQHKSHDEAKEIFLNLTPMIDIMTCLLFFLLLGFKSQTMQLETMKEMELPQSSSEKGFAVSLTVAVSPSEMLLNNSHVMFLKGGEPDAKDIDGNKIIPLYNRMLRLLNLRELNPQHAQVLLLADKRLKTDLITKIMKTSGMAGVPNFHLGVAHP